MGAWPAQAGREPEKQGCMCDEFVRRRWLSSSQGFVPILATCTSFKKWVRTIPFDAASSRARPSANDVAFRFTPACNTSGPPALAERAPGPVACRPRSRRLWEA